MDNLKAYQLHFAIHGEIAVELIMNRANSEKENMGLTTRRKCYEDFKKRCAYVV